MSNNLIQRFYTSGGVRNTLKYLEYLTLKCNVPRRELHRELGCLFVRYINKKVKTKGKEYDEVKDDEEIAGIKDRLRGFLLYSILYEPLEIEKTMDQSETV